MAEAKPWPYAPAPEPEWWGNLAARVAADPEWYAKFAASEASRGNPFPLIARVDSGTPLSRDEIMFIRRALEATAGRETAGGLRETAKVITAWTFDKLVDEEGLAPKQALARVTRIRNRSVRYVRMALAAYGKRRRQRRRR